MVYVDSPPVPKRRQGMTSKLEDPSVKLRLKNSGPYKMVRARLHTMTIEIDGVHSVVAIDQLTLSIVAPKFIQDTSARNCNDPFSQEHEFMLRKPHTVEPDIEEKVKTVPKNDGPSPTTQEKAVRTKLREERSQTDGEEGKQPMAYVVD